MFKNTLMAALVVLLSAGVAYAERPSEDPDWNTSLGGWYNWYGDGDRGDPGGDRGDDSDGDSDDGGYGHGGRGHGHGHGGRGHGGWGGDRDKDRESHCWFHDCGGGTGGTVTEVPVPATMPLMAAGFGLLGLMALRNKG